MNWFDKLRLRFRALFGKEKLDAEMDEELRSHIELRTQANIEAVSDGSAEMQTIPTRNSECEVRNTQMRSAE